MKGLPCRTLRSDRSDDYFNYFLRNARFEAGYTMGALAQEVGVSKQAIACYERLRYLPPPFTARRLARVLGKSISELFPKSVRQLTKVLNISREKGYCVKTQYPITGLIPLSSVPADELPTVDDSEIIKTAEREELVEIIRGVLGTLSPNQKDVINLRYGIANGNPSTLEEIGRMFRITSERVRQIEAKALKRLRHPPRARRLAGFLELVDEAVL